MFTVTGCISAAMAYSQVLPGLSHAHTDRGSPVTCSDGSCCITVCAIRICPAPQRSTTMQTTTMSAPPGWCQGHTRKQNPKASPSISRDSPTLRIPVPTHTHQWRTREDYRLSLGYLDESAQLIASERAW